jgi:translation initiation factor IF-3
LKPLRKNDEIRVARIRLIDPDGEQLGIFSVVEARAKATERNLDLVEISPQADPPVCKIMDFGAHFYSLKKLEKKQKMASKGHETKEIKFGIRISDHDFEVRLTKTRSFLEKGHPVKVILQFRGREQSHAEIGMKRLDEMVEKLTDIAKKEYEPRPQGRSVLMELRPLPKKKR